MELGDDQMCFVCGRKNPIGLKLEFSFVGDVYVTRFTPRPEHQGYVGVTHGGLVSTVLDEVMARLVHVKGYNAVTAEMTVRLKQPARTGEELLFRGRIEGERGRVIDCAAEARNASGAVIAEARARMLKVKEGVAVSEESKGYVVVYDAMNETNANIVKAALESEGIEAIVRPLHTSWFDGAFVPAEGLWGQVAVPAADEERARAALEAYGEIEESEE